MTKEEQQHQLELLREEEIKLRNGEEVENRWMVVFFTFAYDAIFTEIIAWLTDENKWKWNKNWWKCSF